MRKALTITLVAALALFAGSAAYANYCARDVVPASTILVPYAVQDMSGTNTADTRNYTTILTVTNVSREAQIIHITVWNAVSKAVLDFNEVLTGYDVWQIYMRDMINNNFSKFDTTRGTESLPSQWVGNPNTGDRTPFEWGPDGQSAYPGYTTLLQTPEKTSVFDDLDNCTSFGPPYTAITQAALNTAIGQLRSPLYSRTHAGCDDLEVRGGFETDWLASLPKPPATSPIWFYVTVDVVTDCNTDFPDTPGYADQWYKYANVLIGDIIYLSEAANYSEAISAVHIESDLGNYPTNVNFYDPKASPSFDLEPLATAFAFNFYNLPNERVSTNVMVWKNYADFFPNGTVDDCGYYLYYTWDFDEHTTSRAGSCRVSPCDPSNIDPNEFPFETQSVPVTKENFDLVSSKGWMLLVFPPSYGPNWDDPTTSGNQLHDSRVPVQAWVGTKIVYGTYSMSLEAATMANAHCFGGQYLPQLGVDFIYDPPAE